MFNKQLVRIALSISLLFSAIPTVTATPADVTPIVFIDGKRTSFDVPPTVVNGTTLVPLRKIFESLGAEIAWNGDTRTVSAKKGDVSITYTIGDTVSKKNTVDINLPVPGQIIEGSTMVPLRFVGEALGATVGWDSPSRTITISSSIKKEVKVNRVVEGDTVQIDWNGKEETIRLIGVDTMESMHPSASKNVETGKIASEYTKQALTGVTVLVEVDVEERDSYGRLLGYVYLSDGTMFNAKVVSEGYAKTAATPPNVRWVDLFTHLQTDAREDGRGVWASVTFETPITPSKLKYDPNGPDRDCSDFATHEEAQAFFIAAGGPAIDRHRLDSDKNGLACEPNKSTSPVVVPANTTTESGNLPANSTNGTEPVNSTTNNEPANNKETTGNTVPANSKICLEINSTYASALENVRGLLISNPHLYASHVKQMFEQKTKDLEINGCPK
ncbi:stalk domain-containing protein [Paenibacillus silviterrae]|uniref:stalk domain-containing protein n=1 Tax=Paenibacillus silviterrae TaxID=3242194 RepID=UPI002543740E|nr:stalk domain-containing protein [Paenibacillus chinjuensis]